MSRLSLSMFGLLAICLAITSVTGARADEPEPAGVWVTERGSDRLFLVLYADGRYRMARARAAARAPLAVQWDDGTFAVGAGWVTLTAQPAACKSRLEGHFQFRFVGRYLRLEGPQQAFTFGRLPARQAPLAPTFRIGGVRLLRGRPLRALQLLTYGASGPTSFSVSRPYFGMPGPISSAPMSSLPLRGRPSMSSIT